MFVSIESIFLSVTAECNAGQDLENKKDRVAKLGCYHYYHPAMAKLRTAQLGQDKSHFSSF